jgi:hypothetical protein
MDDPRRLSQTESLKLTNPVSTLQKDDTIIRLLTRLRERLGAGAFDVVDRWESDLCAIGFARPDDHRVLVYVCTYERQDGAYFVSLELPPAADSDMAYSSAGERDVASFEELVEIIQRHLFLPVSLKT